MRIVIIGNSATAVGAIETIRGFDQNAEITVISDEPHAIYSRPMLSHYLGGEIDKLRLAYRSPDFHVKHHVVTLLDNAVESIDTEQHQVVTKDGQSHTYDKLLIATGGTPIIPVMPGIASEGVYSFTRLDDVNGIIDYVERYSVKRAVVVGGGMIGMKATDALLQRGVQITLVELAPRILIRALDETAAAMMTTLLKEEGVNVLTESTATEILSVDGRISGIELQDKSRIDCQLLVFGIGVRPNAQLAVDAGIEVNRGIVVDEYMRTSAPDVYAAGDVAEAYDLVVDMNRTVAIWPNAYRQGAIAGAHMVGHPRSDQGGIAMNAVEVAGHAAISIGNATESGDDYTVLTDLDERKRHYKRLVIYKNRLVGAILVGNINRAGIYTGLIRAKIDVSDCGEALLGENISLLSVPDTYRKHVVTGAGIEV